MEKWDLPSPNLERNTDRICQFLEEKNLKASFFWLGSEAKRYPELVRKINALGHEIGVHSFYHIKVNELSENVFRENTSKAIETLEDISGKKVKAYRAPGLSMNEKTLWAFETLIDLGIEMDSSLLTGQFVDNKRIPNQPFIADFNGLKIREFPISSFPFLNHSFNYGGSGYFRISPYKFLQKRITKSPYIMSYFHPRDFDLNIHRKISGNPYLKLKYRIGAENAFQKLEKLSEKVNWISLEKASGQMNWCDAKIVRL